MDAIIGTVLLIWSTIGLFVFAWEAIRASGDKTSPSGNGLHDGSSFTAGFIISLLLGPIAILFYVLDWHRTGE